MINVIVIWMFLVNTIWWDLTTRTSWKEKKMYQMLVE